VVKQWEVWTFDFPEAGAHPAIIISHPDRVANAPLVNVLICSSQRATRAPRKNEVLLDESDGLDWPTLCRCDLTYLVRKEQLHRRRGIVGTERQRQITRVFVASFGFNLV
jgi:mRNA-degrading endonuclease toxin of MazEF toxin-antitoxin module